jgi:cytochrome d ubiquinol oxidase subunit I
MLTTEILSRAQFAFTIGFHIIWPTVNIGLGLFLLIMEIMWLKTNNKVYLSLYKFWVKIFALAFGMGVVTGIPMSFQFGTNFSKFSELAGSVIGPLIGVEVMTAFFLEAAFIGVMIFGWKRFSPKIHLTATLLVVLGTHHSAFWILSLNSWMHTPDGIHIVDGIIRIDDWLKVIFNPSFPYRLIHMILACYTTASLLLAGIFSYYIIKHKYLEVSKKGLSLALWVLLIIVPLQIFMGDMHGLNTIKYQPLKIAAMEGLWDTSKGAPTVLFGIPSEKLEKNLYSIEIPKLSSIILTHDPNGEVKGIKEWPKDSRPNIPLVFYTFRIMVGLGFIFLFTSIIGLILRFKNKLYSYKPFLWLCVLLTPAGFISTISGWIVAEAGRQPWVINNILKTSKSISDVRPELVIGSFSTFLIVYPIIFIAFLVYSGFLVKKGPLSPDDVLKEMDKEDSKWVPTASHTTHVISGK